MIGLIAISDAETAMMSEGHDVNHNDWRNNELQEKVIPELKGKIAVSGNYVDGKWVTKPLGELTGEMRNNPQVYKSTTLKTTDGKWIPLSEIHGNNVGDGKHVGYEAYAAVEKAMKEGYKPSQEPGMRLHYDRTLPKIAEELTKKKRNSWLLFPAKPGGSS